MPLTSRLALACSVLLLCHSSFGADLRDETTIAPENLRLEHDSRGVLSSLAGKTGRFLPENPESEQGRAELEKLIDWLRPMLRSQGMEQLRYVQTNTFHRGRTMILGEWIRDIPVLHGRVALSSSTPSGEIDMITASFLPDRALPRAPGISSADAVRFTKAWFEEEGRMASIPLPKRNCGREIEMLASVRTDVALAEPASPTLFYQLAPDTPDWLPPRLVWEVVLVEQNGSPYRTVFVDSQSGKIAGWSSVGFLSEPASHAPSGSSTVRSDGPATPVPELAAALPGSGCFPAIPSVGNESLCPWTRLTFGPVDGATIYNMQYAYTPSFESARTAFDAGGPAVCEVQPSVRTYFRARACNGCACSPWSSTVVVDPFNGQCESSR